MDDGHRLQRVVDAVLAVGERVLDRQHEARRELAERTAGVHERGRVGLEPALRHQRIELLRDFSDRALGRAVRAIGFRDDGRDAPEEIFRLLHRLAFVLHEVALLENGARVLRDGRGVIGREERLGVGGVGAEMGGSVGVVGKKNKTKQTKA